MVNQIMYQYIFLLVSTVIGRSHTNFGFSEDEPLRLKEENFCSNNILSNQHWGLTQKFRATAEPLRSFQHWAFFITDSNGLRWLKAPSFLEAVAWKQSPGNSGIKVNY